MSITLTINNPISEIGFIHRRRSFCVNGKIIADEVIDDNALLKVELIDNKGNVVRYCQCERKNKDIYTYHPLVTTYNEKLDPNRDLMNKFGFAELVCDDLNNPNDSIHLATKRCWYSDTDFKAIIVNASNVETGALLDDGLNYVDDNNQPYSLLDIGRYTIVVTLNNYNHIYKVEKEIEIGYRKIQAICRFNPVEHKSKMVKWCDDMGFDIIKDCIPGYLDSYLDEWLYHKGILKMYRSNDVCMYENVDVKMFLYLIDKTSTSYSTELAYLQSNNLIDRRLTCYHYDIGEAKVGKYQGNIVSIENGQAIIERIDEVNDFAKENIYYLDERHIINSNVTSVHSLRIQIKGVIAPWQMDKDDFVLNDDNTYTINNYPDEIEYYINGVNYQRKCDMERIDDKSIGDSVFEFYNIIDIDPSYIGKDVEIYAIISDKRNHKFKTNIIKLHIN